MIYENVKKLLAEIPKTNPFGEKITLEAAVKFQPPEAINEAISAGVSAIGDNHVQEFRDKYDLISGSPSRHFIGHLQTNKIKYLLGKCDLYESIDRLPLAEELSKKSLQKGVTSRILLQVNAGNEETKGGFSFGEIENAYAKISQMPNLEILGLMAMLPFTDDEILLASLAAHMRRTYDDLRAYAPQFRYLSMGMSGDWKICVKCGSNLIRVGTTIFGPRIYK